MQSAAGTTPITPREHRTILGASELRHIVKTFSLGGFPKLQRRAGKGFLRDETNKVTATNERDISALTEDSQRDLISDSAKNNVPLDCK